MGGTNVNNETGGANYGVVVGVLLQALGQPDKPLEFLLILQRLEKEKKLNLPAKTV